MQQVRICPLSKAADSPAQRLLDMTDIIYNGLIRYDETFFTSSPACWTKSQCNPAISN